MSSLRSALVKVGKTPPFNIPKGFQTYPNSLKEMIRIMNLPNPQINLLQHRRIHDFSENDAQGLTYAYGNIWFLSSQYKIFKYSIQGSDLYLPNSVRRLKTATLSHLIGETNLDTNDFDHISDIDYFKGIIFALVRSTRNDKPHVLLGLSKNLDVVGYSSLSMDTSDSFCSVNPWNELLYASSKNNTHFLITYDISKFYEVLPDHNKWRKNVNIGAPRNTRFYFYKEDGSPEEVHSIQGIAFSKNGRLYVARYNKTTWGWDNYLQIYNSLTGVRLGKKEYDFAGTWDEIEGISIHPSGVIYVSVCDNDYPSTDEFEIHAFKYPNPSFFI